MLPSDGFQWVNGEITSAKNPHVSEVCKVWAAYPSCGNKVAISDGFRLNIAHAYFARVKASVSKIVDAQTANRPSPPYPA